MQLLKDDEQKVEPKRVYVRVCDMPSFGGGAVACVTTVRVNDRLHSLGVRVLHHGGAPLRPTRLDHSVHHERVHRRRRKHSPHALPNDVAPNLHRRQRRVTGHQIRRRRPRAEVVTDPVARHHPGLRLNGIRGSPHREHRHRERRADHVDDGSEVHRIPGGVRRVPASEARDHSRDVNRHRQRRPVRSALGSRVPLGELQQRE
mmetsp:Transcript_7265/g.29464  ORF Transcript_7265/g.29464 Transcript_7265/m.29464 type:complete len:203 (+) Transcript_7265:1156-1764(+)